MSRVANLGHILSNPPGPARGVATMTKLIDPLVANSAVSMGECDAQKMFLRGSSLTFDSDLEATS